MGWNGSKQDSAKTEKTATRRVRSNKHGRLVGLLVAVAIGAAITVLILKNETEPKTITKESRQQLIKERRPRIGNAGRTIALSRPENPAVVQDAGSQRKLQKEALARARLARNTLFKPQCVESNSVGEVRLQRYKNPIHQELVKYVVPGMACGTPDPIDDDEALRFCDEPPVYDFNDPDDVLNEKKCVEEMAKELKAYLLNGGHADRFFLELMEQQDHEAEMLEEVRQQVGEAAEANGEEVASKALETYNEFLTKQGLPRIEKEEILGLHAEREEDK